MNVVAVVPNLFDRSRFGGRVVFIDHPDQIAEQQADLVIVDLDRCEDVEGFRVDGPTVIGFGPHVDTSLHGRAVDAGYDEVLVRSAFFKRLPRLLELDG